MNMISPVRPASELPAPLSVAVSEGGDCPRGFPPNSATSSTKGGVALSCCPHCGADLREADQVFDVARRAIRVGNDERFPNPQQWRLLTIFRRGLGRTLTWDYLIFEMWGGANEPSAAANVLKTHVCHLRKHLVGTGYDIVNIFGVGYRLERQR